MYAVVVAVVFDTDVIVIKRSVEVGGREVCVWEGGVQPTPVARQVMSSCSSR